MSASRGEETVDNVLYLPTCAEWSKRVLLVVGGALKVVEVSVLPREKLLRLNSQKGTSALDALFAASWKLAWKLAVTSNSSCSSELQHRYTWPFFCERLVSRKCQLPVLREFQTRHMCQVNSTNTQQSSMLALSVSRLESNAQRLCSFLHLV